MPSRTKLKNAAIAARSAALPKIPNELIDQFIIGPMTGEAVNAASMAFKKALIERAMGAELGHHVADGGAEIEDHRLERGAARGAFTDHVAHHAGHVGGDIRRDRLPRLRPVAVPAPDEIAGAGAHLEVGAIEVGMDEGGRRAVSFGPE